MYPIKKIYTLIKRMYLEEYLKVIIKWFLHRYKSKKKKKVEEELNLIKSIW